MHLDPWENIPPDESWPSCPILSVTQERSLLSLGISILALLIHWRIQSLFALTFVVKRERYCCMLSVLTLQQSVHKNISSPWAKTQATWKGSLREKRKKSVMLHFQYSSPVLLMLFHTNDCIAPASLELFALTQMSLLDRFQVDYEYMGTCRENDVRYAVKNYLLRCSDSAKGRWKTKAYYPKRIPSTKNNQYLGHLVNESWPCVCFMFQVTWFHSETLTEGTKRERQTHIYLARCVHTSVFFWGWVLATLNLITEVNSWITGGYKKDYSHTLHWSLRDIMWPQHVTSGFKLLPSSPTF